MTIYEKFNQLIEQEHEDFLEMVDGYDSWECIENAEYIYKFQSIYEYLTDEQPLEEKDMEHLLKIDNPIETVCRMYNPIPEEYHEEILTCIGLMTKEEIFVGECRPDTEKLFKIMSEELEDSEHDSVKRRAFEVMRKGAKSYDEYGVKTLLQFKEPLKLITDIASTNTNPSKLFLDAVAYVDCHDIYSMPYELVHENITYESRCRHEAIIKTTDLIEKPSLATTMNWIEFCKDVQTDSEDRDDYNPYSNHITAMEEIAEKYGGQILQQLYDMGRTNPILDTELSGAAMYLVQGGNINDVPRLAEEGEFEYDCNEQGGMQLC